MPTLNVMNVVDEWYVGLRNVSLGAFCETDQPNGAYGVC